MGGFSIRGKGVETYDRGNRASRLQPRAPAECWGEISPGLHLKNVLHILRFGAFGFLCSPVARSALNAIVAALAKLSWRLGWRKLQWDRQSEGIDRGLYLDGCGSCTSLGCTAYLARRLHVPGHGRTCARRLTPGLGIV